LTINDEFANENNSKEESSNNINAIYENKDKSSEQNIEDKNIGEILNNNENGNLGEENLSNYYYDLNYLDNYDKLEEVKIMELFDGLNLERNNNKNNNNDE